MEPPKYLISPVAAIGTACVAAVALVAAILTRGDAPPPAAPEVSESQREPEPEPETAPPTPPKPHDPPVDPAVASVPPKIEGVRAKAQVGTLGVDVQLDVAIALAGAPDPKANMSIRVGCKLDGEWFSGSAFVRLAKLAAGTNVTQHKITLGGQHAFTTPPTECHLGFEYTAYQPHRREWLAKMCWDGASVIDKPCAVTASKDPSLAVSAVRVATTLDRYRSRKVGSPVDLEVSLDAEIKRPIADWYIEVAANCTLPDGTTHAAAERVYTHDVHAGRPFTGKTWLFRGAQQMADVPESCTVAVELADRQRLVREPVAAYCWRDGAMKSGAC